jgi:signal transduction histidine kinase
MGILGDARIRIGLAAGLLVATTVLAILGLRNLATWGWTTYGGPSPVEVAATAAAAWSFGIAGLVTLHRRPGNRVGPLMVLAGVTLLTWPWVYLPIPLLVSLGHWASQAPVILLGIVVLAYPTGGFTSSPARAWVAMALVYLFGVQLARTLVTPLGLRDCLECRSFIVLSYDERVASNLYHVGEWLLLVLAAALVGLLVHRWLGATGPARRVLAPVWLAGLGFIAVALTGAVLGSTAIGGDDLSFVPPPGQFIRLQVPQLIWNVMPWVAATSLFLVPIALLWGILRAHLAQAAVSALALELRRGPDRPPLVESLRRALADRSLDLGLWSRPAAAYVTPEGLPLPLPETTEGRAVTRLDGEDGPLAVIVHDPALGDRASLVEGVAAVAHLALENERLHAEVKAQLEEVRASRERIVSAADAERRRVERDIHDGAQQRLVTLSLALGMAHAKAVEVSPEVAATLREAEGELKRAIVELRELARGIHPAILTEAGLGPALESLAEHSPLSVHVEADLDGRRLPPLVEATAYFVAAEALTNVAKHASANRATLTAAIADGWLRLSVADDGVGGADPARGSGLRGLLDRVAALGGRLRVEDAGASGGTRLEAEIPCG